MVEADNLPEHIEVDHRTHPGKIAAAVGGSSLLGLVGDLLDDFKLTEPYNPPKLTLGRVVSSLGLTSAVVIFVGHDVAR